MRKGGEKAFSILCRGKFLSNLMSKDKGRKEEEK